MSVLLAAGGLAATAAGAIIYGAVTAPPRPSETPTVDTAPRPDPDEEWALETTSEFRAIRADLDATGAFERLRLTGAPLDPLSRLKAELAWRRRRRLAGWTDHVRGRLA